MNANFGIIMRQGSRKTKLSKLIVEPKKWGNEAVEVEDNWLQSPGFDGIKFKIYPVTEFIRRKLPGNIREAADLEYAWMSGEALDVYQSELIDQGTGNGMLPFEHNFLAFLNTLDFWAVLFAPEGDRLDSFVEADADEVLRMLRRGVLDLSSCEGFLAAKA